MKKENKNNYYNDEDKVNFEKLNNFNKFNSKNIKSVQLNNHNTRYSNSDKNYFNTILKTEENTSLLNNNKEKKYYNNSDFKKFDQLNNFPEYNDKIDYENNTCTANGTTVKENEMVSIDGSMGTVFIGQVPTVEPKVTKDFQTILSWAQSTKQLGIRANADTPDAAKLARQYGAQGIGLCRTERMFNDIDRIGLFVEMIMAQSEMERNKVIKKLQLYLSIMLNLL